MTRRHDDSHRPLRGRGARANSAGYGVGRDGARLLIESKEARESRMRDEHRVKYSYDEKCFELAQHFYPRQSFAFLEALAQEFQDCVEGREVSDELPARECGQPWVCKHGSEHAAPIATALCGCERP